MFPTHDTTLRATRPVASAGLVLVLAVAAVSTLVFSLPEWLAFLALGEPSGRRTAGLWLAYVAYQLGFLQIFAHDLEDRLGRLGFALLVLASGTLGVALSPSDDSRGAFAQSVLVCFATAYVVVDRRRFVIFPGATVTGAKELSAAACFAIVAAIQLVAIAVGLVTVTPGPLLTALMAGGFLGYWLRKNVPAHSEDGATSESTPRAERLPRSVPRGVDVRDRPGDEPLELTSPFDVHSTEPEIPAVGRPAPSPGLETDWTVYLTSPSPPPKLGPLAKRIASKTGEALHDIKRRIRSSRGIVARELDRAVADDLVVALRASGLEARCLPSSASLLPRCKEAVEAAWTTDSIAFRLRDGDMHDYPWRRILVVAAYVLFERAGYEDVEVPPAWDEGPIRWERRPLPPRPVRHVAFVVGGREVESTLWITVRDDVTRFPGMGAGSFTRLGEECASRRDNPVVGDGVFDLARRGSLREYEFADRFRSTEYLEWLVLRARAEDTRTSFLE